MVWCFDALFGLAAHGAGIPTWARQITRSLRGPLVILSDRVWRVCVGCFAQECAMKVELTSLVSGLPSDGEV
jgi:hypothetical protein